MLGCRDRLPLLILVLVHHAITVVVVNRPAKTVVGLAESYGRQVLLRLLTVATGEKLLHVGSSRVVLVVQVFTYQMPRRRMVLLELQALLLLLINDDCGREVRSGVVFEFLGYEVLQDCLLRNLVHS